MSVGLSARRLFGSHLILDLLLARGLHSTLELAKGSLGSGLSHWHGLKKGFSQLFPDPQQADAEFHMILSNTRSETG